MAYSMLRVTPGQLSIAVGIIHVATWVAGSTARAVYTVMLRRAKCNYWRGVITTVTLNVHVGNIPRASEAVYLTNSG